MNASPIEFVPAAQAVTISKHAPLAPNMIATLPAAKFPIAIGMKNGETRSYPFLRPFSFSFSMVSNPPIPELKMIPKRLASISSGLSLASSYACFEAIIANWLKRSKRFASFLLI